MAVQLKVVASASTATDGPLFPVSWTEVYRVLKASITRGEDILNPAFTRAIEATPEGGLLELTLGAMPTLPVMGDTGQVVADHLNSQWRQGKLRYERGPDKGRVIQLWPKAYGGTGQLATYDARTKTVTVRWIKRQAQLLLVIFVIVGILIVLGVVDAVLSSSGRQITFHGIVPVVTPKPPPGTVASFWDNLSFLDKALIVGGALGLVGFGVYVWGEEKIHAAGATRSSINIYEGAPPLAAPAEGGSTPS
jgi:hypothetical protein